MSNSLAKSVSPIAEHAWTLFSDDDIKVYSQNLKKISVRVLPEVAHDPLEAPSKFIEALVATI